MTVAAGIVEMPEEIYHRHPALSYSGAKLLLPPGTPALYRHRMANPIVKAAEWDFGHAAHKMVLGVGAPVRYIQGKTAKGEPSEGWGSQYAKDQRAEAYAAGEVPLLESDREAIEGMTAALREHPGASRLLSPDSGTPEQNLFWDDDETGCPLRARLDWLPTTDCHPFILADYKSCVSAAPAAFAKAVDNYRYYLQAAFYLDAVKSLGLSDDPYFVFIAQEKTPPYQVATYDLDPDALRLGVQKMRQAIDTYMDCAENDTWPGYSPEITTISLPPWAYRELDAA